METLADAEYQNAVTKLTDTRREKSRNRLPISMKNWRRLNDAAGPKVRQKLETENEGPGKRGKYVVQLTTLYVSDAYGWNYCARESQGKSCRCSGIPWRIP